jgi:hypothetical protein
MKNTIELQLRALRSPRLLKKNCAGDPDLIDVWAMPHSNSSSHQFAIAVKFGRDIAPQADEIDTGTLFTVKGRLDQSRNTTTGIDHTFVWAEPLSDLVHSTKPQSESIAPKSRAAHEEENPELELSHA